MPQPHIFMFQQIPAMGRGGEIVTKPMLSASMGAAGITSGITTFPPGAAIRLHSHNTEEMVTILEGDAVVDIEGSETEIEQYDTTFVPPGVFHRFINRSGSIMRILWVYGSSHVTRTFADTGETVGHLSDEDRGVAQA